MSETEKQIQEPKIIDSSTAEKAMQDANVTEILEKYDKESLFRTLQGNWALVIKFLAISFTVFQLYTAIFGPFFTQIQRAIHLGFAITLAFLLYPATRKKPRDSVAIEDIFLAVVGAWTCAYLVVNYQTIIFAAGRNTPTDIAHGVVLIILILEITRRIVGLPLALIAMFFLAYARFGSHIPGLLGHRGFFVNRIVHHLYLTTEGIIGVPIGVSTDFVFLFILFGAFLQRSGSGKLFIDMALALTGKYAGGPAKVAVVSSCLFGTVSGSSIANAVTTGPFTIPLMKDIGYRKEFAAAVEATASTGGQILPPIMGAAAFIMSQFIGVPYLEIAKAAALPALLYFVAVFIMVHLEAKRLGLRGLPKEQLPSIKWTLLGGGHLIIPLIVIIYTLLQGFTPSTAALYGIFATVIVVIVHAAIVLVIKIVILKEGNILQYIKNFVVEWIKIIIESMENGARAAITVAIACACAGIIIGIVTLTGLGLKIASAIVALASGVNLAFAYAVVALASVAGINLELAGAIEALYGGELFLTLVFTMIASILLGLGLPTTAKYIILSAMAAPAIARFDNTSMLAAHMFILYFGVFADITPPVALVTYATAGIAKANPNTASFIALRLGVAGFIVPFVFIYSPELLLIDPTWSGVLLVLITTIAGICSLAFATTGYWIRSLSAIERLLLFIGAINLIFVGWVTDLTGAAMLIIVYLMQKKWPGNDISETTKLAN